jgi:shikimate kinase
MPIVVPDPNLILTGYTGSSQASIDQQVAERLKLRYVNVDSLLETRAGMDMETMRVRFGETRLKIIEQDVMQDMLLYRNTLIRVSGQTLLRADNGRRLLETGYAVCVVMALNAVLRRLHLTMGGRYHDPNERALAVGHLQREWQIRKLHEIDELDTSHLTESQTVEAICTLWQQATDTLVVSGTLRLSTR